MNCPRCNTDLVKETIKDINVQFEIDKCPSCDGVWFDEGELAKIDRVVEPIFLEIRHIPTQGEQLQGLYCPACYDHPLMEKAEHPRDNKVIIDFCDSCKGIWLDKGELEAIQKENWWITVGNFFRILGG